MVVRLRYLGLAAALLPLVPASPATGSPNELPQSSAWDLGKVDGVCTIGAWFGNGDGKFRIEIGKPPLTRRLTLRTLSTDPPKEWFAAQISIAFDGAAPVERPGFVKTNEARTVRIQEVRFDANELIRLTTARTMTIDGPSKRTLHLTAESSAPALKSLEICVAEQLIEWAVPPLELAKVAVPVEMERQALVNNSDYPRHALYKREQGTVGMLINVDKRGRAASCRVVHSSYSALLDQASCGLVKSRLRARPARDAGGKPVPDWTYYALRWVIPT